jgi:hypothetical protein
VSGGAPVQDVRSRTSWWSSTGTLTVWPGASFAPNLTPFGFTAPPGAWPTAGQTAERAGGQCGKCGGGGRERVLCVQWLTKSIVNAEADEAETRARASAVKDFMLTEKMMKVRRRV